MERLPNQTAGIKNPVKITTQQLIGFAIVIVISFAAWIKGIVSDGRTDLKEANAQYRQDLKEQLKEANSRTDEVTKALQENNRLNAQIITLVNNLTHAKGNEAYSYDSTVYALPAGISKPGAKIK